MIAGTMAEFFATTAREDRGILFIDPVSQRERLWTYADMYGDAERMSSRLQGIGFRKRFLAVIWMEQTPACFRAFMSVLLAGGIPIPLHSANKPEETVAVIRQLEAEAVLLSTENAAKMRSLSSDAPIDRSPLPHVCYLDGDTGEAIEGTGERGLDGQPRRDYVPPEETAVIFMSSGSTGMPKGIMLSERNLLSNVSSIQSYLKLTEEDRVLLTKSFGYCSTITGEWLLALHAGAHIVMSQGYFHPLYAVSFIREHRATFMCAVPSMLLPLLKSSKWEHTDLRSLRQMIVVGGQMPPEMLLKLQQRLPWTTISPCYGLTEASPRVAYLPAYFADRGQSGLRRHSRRRCSSRYLPRGQAGSRPRNRGSRREGSERDAGILQRPPENGGRLIAIRIADEGRRVHR